MNGNLRESGMAAWCAMLLIVVVIIISIATHVVSSIWEYATVFLAFMAAFCHLAAIILKKMSGNAARKLDYFAMIFAILFVVALIVVFILDWV